MRVNQNGRDDQTLGALGEQAQALLELVTDLKKQVDAVERAQAQARVCINGGLDLGRCSQDELLDEWQRTRGPRSEAFLLTRIFQRRAMRRASL